MATFSTNQTRQVYVANVLKSPTVVDGDAAGSIAVKADTAKSHLYFQHKGFGGITRSDLISTKNITYVKATDADNLKTPLKRTKVVLDSAVNGGVPISGQDYILKIIMAPYIGISESEQYAKFGMVHAVSGMTAATFYKTLALSLVKNFSREEVGLFKFYLETGGTAVGTVGTLVEVTSATVATSLTGTYTGLVIEEKEQEWVLGTYQQRPLSFSVYADEVSLNGDSQVWGIATSVAPATLLTNGKSIADLEYFAMGERADQYRNIGWPNSIPTKYLVDSTIAYNVIDIHYAFTDEGIGVQRSEKDITILVPKVGATNTVSNKLANDIITALSTATGLTIAKLAV